MKFLFLFFIILFFDAKGQVKYKNIEQKVLQKAIVDSTFVFGKWTINGDTETHLTFLGKVTTKRGQTFKIINSVFFWGQSYRATSRIFVYNIRNQYVGNYYLTTDSHLPQKLEGEKLIFKNTDEDCDKKLQTIVNLRNGLPKQFFRKCNGKFGDIYSFEN